MRTLLLRRNVQYNALQYYWLLSYEGRCRMTSGGTDG